jgi:hypothetical protein
MVNEMNNKTISAFFFLLIIFSYRLFAHCDGIDGPVVKAATEALQNRDVNLVLIWVQEKDETEVINAFESTLKIRELSPDVKDLADKYFFETVVRLHRSGEGEPYTGLKPAGRNLGPVILLADKSINNSSDEELVRFIISHVNKKLEENFDNVNALSNYKTEDISKGREFVEAYIQFIHYAEKLYELTSHSEGHSFDSHEIHE